MEENTEDGKDFKDESIGKDMAKDKFKKLFALDKLMPLPKIKALPTNINTIPKVKLRLPKLKISDEIKFNIHNEIRRLSQKNRR